MSNYTEDNLIPIPISKVPAGTLAIKVGDLVLTSRGFPSDSGSSNATYYKCASVDTDNKTWTGYKAVLADGVYSFEDTVTEGLSYGEAITPEINHVYTDGCFIHVADLWSGYDPALVFYAPLADATEVAVTGQKLSITGSGEFTTFKGVPCCSGMRVLAADDNQNIPVYAESRTLSGWVCFNNTSGWNFAFGSGGNDSNTLAIGCNGKIICYSSSSGLTTTVTPSTGRWYHLLVTYDGKIATMYVDGVASGTLSKTLSTTSNPGVYAGYLATQNGFDFNGYVAGIRVYNKVLSQAEISVLANEFTPTE